MRPLKLELQGFTAFRDLQSIVLKDFDLFVITGPTGAGKSSLLDAMVFALFGKVPRMGSQGLSDLVSHGIAEARITLEFSIDGTLYRVARRLPRRGSTSATFEKSDGAEWASDVDGSGVRAVDRRVIDLLRLDFDAFTRAVVLPQGEFQRFLRGEADKRREVLADLLGLKVYETMGARARGRVRELDARTNVTQEILDNQYADATAERVAELQAEMKSSVGRVEQLATAMISAGELDNQATRIRGGREVLGRRLDELSATRTGLAETLASCEQAQVREEELERATVGAKDRVEQTQTAAAKANETCETLVKRHGTLADIAGAQAAVEALAQSRADLVTQEGHLATIDAELAELVTQSQAATAEAERLNSLSDAAKETFEESVRMAEAAATQADELGKQLERAEQSEAGIGEATHDVGRHTSDLARLREQAERSSREAEQAEKECERVIQEHTAAVLAQHLKAGDPCPVCHRLLEQDPDVDRHVSDAVASASARRDETRAAADAARHTVTATDTSARDASARLERAKASLATTLQGIDDIEVLRSRSATASTAKGERVDQQLEARKTAEETTQREAGARVTVATLTTTLNNKTAEHKRLAESCDERR